MVRANGRTTRQNRAMSEPYANFAEASQAVLAFLAARIPLGVWMVTHTDGQRWVVLGSRDSSEDGIKVGDVLPYEDSFCSKVACGQAPNIVPDCAQVPAFVEIMNRYRRIGAYLSFPLRRGDGGLFGTLCALDRKAHDAQLNDHQPLLDLLARQLATVLNLDLARESALRMAKDQALLAHSDALTGLLNRRGVDEAVAFEESRARDYGSEVSVIVIDLDDLKKINDEAGHAAGDAYLQRAAAALRDAAPARASVGRSGGDEFIVLLPGIAHAGACLVVEQLQQALKAQQVEASMGCAARKPYRGLSHALVQADAAMYAQKSARKQALATAR